MTQKVYNLQLLTFLVDRYNYQIVRINGIQSEDFWLMNMNIEYPLICITQDDINIGNLIDSTIENVAQAIVSTFPKPSQVLILNTNPASHDFTTNNMIQIVMKEGLTANPILDKHLSGIMDVLHPVNNEVAEKNRLTKVLQKKARSEMFEQMKKTKTLPTQTILIAIVCVVLFVAAFFLSNLSQDSVVGSVMAGAYYKMNVVAAHEYWRLLTSGFVHSDIFHLLMNMISLLNVGLVMEKVYKRSQFWIILLTSIIVGNLFVLIGQPNIVGLGISGGLFGLLGAYIAYLYGVGAFKNVSVVTNLVSLLIMNLIISMLPGISFLAHFGGFLTGLFLGVYFSDSSRLVSLKKHGLGATVLLIALCMSQVPSLDTVTPIYPKTDWLIIQSAYDLGLDGYGDHLKESFIQQMEAQGIEGYREAIEANTRRK